MGFLKYRALGGALANLANLILIGFRGSGKSGVGRAVARRLGWDFVDTDEAIEKATGRTVREIFQTDGEPAFRRLETQVIEAVVNGKQQIISVGGGAVLAEQNRQFLKDAGLCVWLTAPTEELHRRLQTDPRSATLRPALTGLSELDEIRHLLETRRPLYAALADHTIDTLGRTIEEVADAAVAWLQAQKGASESV